MILTYLAQPYTHEDPKVMQERYEKGCEATSILMNKGWMVFSPIAHSHGPAQYGLPKDYGYWRQYCELMLPKCDEVIILTLDGWEESVGVKEEVYLAGELGMATLYSGFKGLKRMGGRNEYIV